MGSATFCVAGERKDPVTGKAQMQLRLVREDKVEEAKKKLSHCFGAYIYSLSKAPLKESSGLVLSNKEAAATSLSSSPPPPLAIINENIRFLSDAELTAKRGTSSAQQKNASSSSSSSSSFGNTGKGGASKSTAASTKTNVYSSS